MDLVAPPVPPFALVPVTFAELSTLHDSVLSASRGFTFGARARTSRTTSENIDGGVVDQRGWLLGRVAANCGVTEDFPTPLSPRTKTCRPCAESARAVSRRTPPLPVR